MDAQLTIVNVAYAQSCGTVADEEVRRCLARGRRVARILPTSAAATQTLRRLADAGTPSLGVETTTLQAWALSRWALYGDGRAAVTSAQRRAAVLSVLRSTPAPHLKADAQGMAPCVERAMRRGGGSAALRNAAPDDPRLSPAQRNLLAVCRAYESLLAKTGLIEPGEAMALLPGAMGAAGWPHLVVERPCDLSDAEITLLAAAATRGGVTLVAQLGKNPAFGASHMLAERLEGACAELGVSVERRDAPASDAPWCSPELAELVGHLFEPPSSPVRPRGDVRFCLPAGQYAEPELLAQVVRDLVAKGCAPRSIAVACRAPLDTAAAVGPRLAEASGRPIAYRAQGSVTAASTNVGRLLTCLATLTDAARADANAPAPRLRSVAADIARNPLSGITTQSALDLDCAWRKDRSTGAAEFLDGLISAAERREPSLSGTPDLPDAEKPVADGMPLTTWSALAAFHGGARYPEPPAYAPAILRAVEALQEGDVAAAAEALVAPLDTATVDDRREHAAAAAIARVARAEESLRPEGLQRAPIDRLLAGLSVPVSWIGVPRSALAAQRQAAVLDIDPNAVEFCTLAQLEGRTFEAVVVCDLTADLYPVSERLDAADAFLQALGCPIAIPALPNLRRQLRGAVEAARSSLVFERCLRNPEAKDLRPCALLEEVVDCYRDDPTDPDDLSRTTGLPKDGRLPGLTLGEERFAALASPMTWTPALHIEAPAATVPRNRATLEALASPGHIWKPSELELYLRCPLRWFYRQQVPSDTIDARFEGREIDAFSCQVLRAFHEDLAAQGTTRVTGDGKNTWGPMLDECFERVLASQDVAQTPLTPTNDLERRKLDAIRTSLHHCVAKDALFPTGFSPRLYEWTFGEHEPVTYGGVRLHGTVNRVDLDEQGRAIVVDYKGAFDDKKYGYSKSGSERLPSRSQALMYASALQRARPDTTAVGAVYVSYNRIRARGFLDYSIAGLLPSDDYLGTKNLVDPAADGSSGFQDLLDYVEREVESAMDRLRDGDVEPRPRFGADSCDHCTVNGCPKRKGA